MSRPTISLRAEDGMTLIELLVAMLILSIGITAIVAGFSSGILAISRARLNSTTAALADKQMELYRRDGFASLTPGVVTPAPATGSDGLTYWVGTTISWTCAVGPPNTTPSDPPPTCTGTPATRPVKLVTVDVRQGSSSGPVAFSESATFDSSTS